MLFEKLQNDSLQARKNKEAARSALLITVFSQVKTIAIDDGHREPNDQDVIKVIRSFLKGINETLELAAQGAISADEKSKSELEKSILESYLPQQLTADDLKKILTDAGVKTIGEAMKLLKEKYDGQYDGKTASAVAKEVVG
ncbi:MAG: GatB/YqeY domain-containing protein [Leptonema sp. (in: Bacteria)]|nr:GatB/YqeY domain-containing protein [Leptonema sp. (in: bacteria)]